MACFENFECIKIIKLKTNFKNCEILISTRILIEYPIMIMERRALVLHARKNKLLKLLFFDIDLKHEIKRQYYK